MARRECATHKEPVTVTAPNQHVAPDPIRPKSPSAPRAALDGGPRQARRRIGEMMLEAGLINPAQLEQGLSVQRAEGRKLVETLIALGHLTPGAFVEFLAKQPGIASIDLSKYEIPRELVNLIPREIAAKHQVFPLDKLGKLLTVGMVCPLDAETVRNIEELTGLRVKALLCSPEDIRAAIERYYPVPESDGAPAEQPANGANVRGLACSIRLSNVAGLIRQIHTLPALPETVQRVRHATLDPETSVKQVADIITLDPPIAAKVLSVANSAAYGFPQRVDDVTLAVSLLGLRETYSIVLSAAVVDFFDKSRTFDYKQFWLESMCCAGATRIVARAANQSRAHGLFAAGLLHDLGRLVLAEVVADAYARVPAGINGEELIVAEEREIGIGHPEAGYVLADVWGLPADITEPIRYHHHPERAADHKAHVAIVAIAESLARAKGETTEENLALVEALKPAFERIGLDPQRGRALIEEYHQVRDRCFKDALV